MNSVFEKVDDLVMCILHPFMDQDQGLPFSVRGRRNGGRRKHKELLDQRS